MHHMHDARSQYLSVIVTASSSCRVADEIPQSNKENTCSKNRQPTRTCREMPRRQTLKSMHEAHSLIVSTKPNQWSSITLPWLLPHTPILKLGTPDQLIRPAVRQCSRLAASDSLKSTVSSCRCSGPHDLGK